MKINIDKEIDKRHCPYISLCTIGTTYYEENEREHLCYLCWLRYCKENNIEIVYD